MSMTDAHHFLYEVVDGSVPKKTTTIGNETVDNYACGCEHRYRNDIPDDGQVTLCRHTEQAHLNWDVGMDL